MHKPVDITAKKIQTDKNSFSFLSTSHIWDYKSQRRNVIPSGTKIPYKNLNKFKMHF